MKYGSNFEGAVVKYEPWAEMPVAQKIWTIIMKRKHGVRWMNKSEFNRFKRKVFLSYTFKDYEKIALVNSKLGDLGFDIFTNFDSANIGDNIVRNFNKQIDECDCFVFVVAEKIQEMSIEEYDLALKRGKPIFVFIKSELFNGEIKKRFGNRLVTLWDDENELVYRIIEEISRYVYRYPLRGYQFEYIVEKIFKEYGCLTKMSNGNENYDILAEKEELKFYIEAKAVRQRVISASVIAKVLISASILEDTYNSKYILVVANELSSQAWEVLEHKKEILVVDIRNLLYIVQYDEVLKSQLLSILEYSTEDIEPKEPIELLKLVEMKHQNKSKSVADDGKPTDNEIIENLIEEIQGWEPKSRKSSEYEKLCIKVLNILFASDLALWSEQQKSNEDLYRFDLICKIKDDLQEAFWKFIEEYFRSKYIIFEFKNYSDMITQKEIYTTDKYLYAKALRCVAIIVSCYGEDKNAKKAIKGTLRENGKLIISISNKDLIELLSVKLQGCSPADYLYNRLDTMLIELDK